MNDPSDNPKLTDEQMTRLLFLGRETPEHNETDQTEEERSRRFFDLLSNPLPADIEVVNALPDVLKRPCTQFEAIAGKPLYKLLLSPHTNLVTLEKIKAYAKERGDHAESMCHYDAALALYYAAIASALVLHGQSISTYRRSELEASLGALAIKDWMFTPIAKLLHQGQERCRQNQEADPHGNSL